MNILAPAPSDRQSDTLPTELQPRLIAVLSYYDHGKSVYPIPLDDHNRLRLHDLRAFDDDLRLGIDADGREWREVWLWGLDQGVICRVCRDETWGGWLCASAGALLCHGYVEVGTWAEGAEDEWDEERQLCRATYQRLAGY